jgi:hypothetical protein
MLNGVSAKMALAVENVLKPKFAPNGEFGDSKVKVIIRPQVQPWHATSTFTHEAALAVARVSPESFWPFSLAVSCYQDLMNINVISEIIFLPSCSKIKGSTSTSLFQL